ncbi:MAG: thioesterase family protein [Salinivirgaceae bacterium]
MEFDIKKGVLGHETRMVEKKDTAKHFGSGLAEVYATPSMIALMEYTAFKSVEAYLPEGFSTVGIQINVQHKKASLPGSIITCNSEVTKVDGKKIHFQIVASDERGEIGTAEHIRYVINSNDFMSKLSS